MVFLNIGQSSLDFALVYFLIEQLIINHHDSRKTLDTEMECFSSGHFIHTSFIQVPQNFKKLFISKESPLELQETDFYIVGVVKYM